MYEDEIGREVQRGIDQRVLYYATLGREQLDERLDVLEREWDVERWLMTVGAGLSVFSLLAGGRRKSRWTLFSGLFGGYLLTQPLEENAIVRLMRTVGIRTRAEIEREKITLMSIRGDMLMMRDDLQEALTQAINELEDETEPSVSH